MNKSNTNYLTRKETAELLRDSLTKLGAYSENGFIQPYGIEVTSYSEMEYNTI